MIPNSKTCGNVNPLIMKTRIKHLSEIIAGPSKGTTLTIEDVVKITSVIKSLMDLGYQQEVTYTQFPCGCNKGFTVRKVLLTRHPKVNDVRLGTGTYVSDCSLYVPRVPGLTFDQASELRRILTKGTKFTYIDKEDFDLFFVEVE